MRWESRHARGVPARASHFSPSMHPGPHKAARHALVTSSRSPLEAVFRQPFGFAAGYRLQGRPPGRIKRSWASYPARSVSEVALRAHILPRNLRAGRYGLQARLPGTISPPRATSPGERGFRERSPGTILPPSASGTHADFQRTGVNSYIGAVFRHARSVGSRIGAIFPHSRKPGRTSTPYHSARWLPNRT